MKGFKILVHGLLSLLILCQFSYAQSFKVNLSAKHQQKLNGTKDYRKKLTRYHKYYEKDSAKARALSAKNYKRKLDSLEQADQLRTGVYSDLDDIKSKMNLDTSAVTFNHLKTIAGEDDRFVNELSQLNHLEEQYGPILKNRDSLLTSQFKFDSLMLTNDSSALALAEQMAMSRISAMGGEEYGALVSQKGATAQDFVPDHSGIKHQVKNAQDLASKDPDDLKKKSINHLSEDQMTKLKATQAKMKLDKLKYAEIGDSKDMDTAVKKSSLRGVPFGKRLDIGGNFQIASTDPVVLELSPQVGYFFNKKWAAGLGLSYRTALGASDSLSNSAAHGYGYQLFTSYDFLKNLLAYAEFNQTKQDRLFGEKNEQTPWKSSFLIGLGLTLKVSTKIDGRIMLLYDMKQESPQKLFGQPVVIKFGFRASELGRHKRFGKK